MATRDKLGSYEVSAKHLGLLFIGKLALGIGIGMILARLIADYSIPLIILGVVIVVPTLLFLIQKESSTTLELEAKIRKRK